MCPRAPIDILHTGLANLGAPIGIAEASGGAGRWRGMGYETGWLMGDDRYDDCIDVEETPNGQLALKRLSDKESYNRVYRIRRAMQLSLSHKILPKEQWTTGEEVSCLFPCLFPCPCHFDAPPPAAVRGRGRGSAHVLVRAAADDENQDVPYISPILEQIKAEQKEKAELDTIEVLPKH